MLNAKGFEHTLPSTLYVLTTIRLPHPACELFTPEETPTCRLARKVLRGQQPHIHRCVTELSLARETKNRTSP